MIKDIELDGKIVKIEYIIPNKIKKFLEENNLDENQLIKSYKWEQCIYEDLLDENHKVRNDFKKARLVINYIYISHDNQIKVSPEDFTKSKLLVSGTWIKGTFFKDFSVGYSIFTE